MRIAGLTIAALVLPAALMGQESGRRTIASEVGGRLNAAAREVVDVGDAMPEELYGFAPTMGEFKGVRTFGQQLKHIAAFGYILCGGIKQEKPPIDTNGDAGPDSIKSKADILKFVRDSFSYCQQALGTIDEKNALESIPGPLRGQTTRLALATFAASHPFDHYGQLVVYLRMNGRVPPASQARAR